MVVHQYEIILVNLDPTIGSEIKKTRPCVVISPDEMNLNIQTVTIAPMTSQSRKYPTRVAVEHNKKSGWTVIDQIRTIDKSRIIKKLGVLTDLEVQRVKQVIKEAFVD